MIRSMTAFASRTGEKGAAAWVWEMRSVNGRGLDLRFRLPDRLVHLEQDLRKAAAAKLSRGNVTISLRLTISEDGGGWSIDPDALEGALAALAQVEDSAASQGFGLRAPTSAEVLNVRGVVSQTGTATELEDSVIKALRDDFHVVLEDFIASRAAEGTALSAVLLDQVNQIEGLVQAAQDAAQARVASARAMMSRALERLGQEPQVDPDRLAQELALLAVKGDVTEELDRLRAHIDGARALMQQGDAVGRKLDFLSQEFNREANTLCAKSQDKDLTVIGLDLKAVIDQMREQIQNVE